MTLMYHGAIHHHVWSFKCRQLQCAAGPDDYQFFALCEEAETNTIGNCIHRWMRLKKIG